MLKAFGIFEFMDFKSILKDIQGKNFKPIYALHGEEPYYIDRLSEAIIEHSLTEEEKDFNQTIVYGKDVDALTIISEAKGFTFIGDRKLIVVREAQDMKDIYDLDKLIPQLNPNNIVVLCHKYKNLDGKRSLTKELAKVGVVFKSEKIKEYQIVDWITKYVQDEKFDITPKAAMLLADAIGNDLSRIVNELDKLAIVLEKGTRISDVHIEENIGISKDYNTFELSNALATRDVVKVFKIVNYFDKNPKGHEIQIIIPLLFKLFSNFMRVHFAPNKTPDAIASSIGMHPYAAKELIKNAANFPPKYIAKNIEVLHEYDLKAKGVGNSSASSGQLLQEMMIQLLN